MLLYLLILGVCVFDESLSAPQYLRAKDNFEEVEKILQDNVLSMNGNIPYLNDSRRHYAEIVYVLLDEARGQSGCVKLPYYERYQGNINVTAPKAIKYPQQVIDSVQSTLDDINKKTDQIQRSVNVHCKARLVNCNEYVQQDVDAVGFPKKQAGILLALGEASAAFLKRHDEFLKASQALRGHQYVIDGTGWLLEAVMKFANVFRLAWTHPGC